MAEFSVRELLASRRGEDYDLWARTINPQFVRILRTTLQRPSSVFRSSSRVGWLFSTDLTRPHTSSAAT